MKRYQLDALANAAPDERGRAILEFLKTSQPSLTVYDFCRTLKEEAFQRFDIVKKLENHFLGESGEWSLIGRRFAFCQDGGKEGIL